MSLIIVDCESDGPIPVDFSLICFGAIIVDKDLDKTFYGRCKPISENWNPEALHISKISREEHLTFDDPKQVFEDFHKWISENSKGKPIFISDNLAYDWMWICYYSWHFCNKNPFGFSGRRIGDIYSGLVNDSRATSEWKRFRQTRHSHHPVDDAKGNAEALLSFSEHHRYRL